MAGRNSKLTKARQKRICDALSEGNTRRVAALLGGISESTFYKWIEEGEKAKSGSKKEFLEAIKKAEAEAEENAISTIKTASRDSWQAAAWWLERKRPVDWAKQERNAARQDNDDKLNAMLEKLDALHKVDDGYSSPS